MDAPSLPATSAPSGAEDAASDERLLARLVWGEPGAEGAFVRRFQSQVYGLASAIVGDGARGAEVAEEALTQACLLARTYDPRRGPAITWVLRITRRLAMEARHPAAPVDAAVNRPDTSEVYLDQRDSRPGPGPTASAGSRTHAVRDALSRLPVEQRRALTLAAFHGYTAREISEAEAIPLDIATARLRSGLTMMRAFSRHHRP
jgi:RNA polymerase sigma factor (sigma-70 family)